MPHLDQTGSRENTLIIAGNSLIGFDKRVDDPMRDDVLDSNLFAQLNANRAADKQQAMGLWFSAYRNALTTLGWKIVREANEQWQRSDPLPAQDKTLQLIQRIGGRQFSRLMEKCVGAFQPAPAPNWQQPTTPWQEIPPSAFLMVPCMQISTHHASIVLAANGALSSPNPNAWMTGEQQALRIRLCYLELDTDHYGKNRWAVREHMKLEALEMIRLTLL